MGRGKPKKTPNKQKKGPLHGVKRHPIRRKTLKKAHYKYFFHIFSRGGGTGQAPTLAPSSEDTFGFGDEWSNRRGDRFLVSDRDYNVVQA